jgi:hypothetical protein
LQWCGVDNIERASNLSLEDFRKNYEEPGVPVIINDIIPQYGFSRYEFHFLICHFIRINGIDGQRFKYGQLNIY